MSSDNSVTKVKPLSDSNYPEWAGEMKAWLMKNSLWRLVSGKEPKPSSGEALDRWKARAEKAAYKSMANNICCQSH